MMMTKSNRHLYRYDDDDVIMDESALVIVLLI